MIHPPFEKSTSLSAVKGVRHGFFGRRCGNSGDGPGLNVSETLGDDPNRVAANRRSAMTALGLASLPLMTLTQTHSSRVITLSGPLPPEARPEGDGLVTREPGLALGILTADCAPVLLADPRAGVIAACHAGWRGAVGGILDNTIAAMRELGANTTRTIAAIGPTISAPNYEVGADFANDLVATDPEARPHFYTPEGKSRVHFDLPGYVAARLGRLGVDSVEIIGGCTYQSPARYFSHRQSTHSGAAGGRQIAIIAID